MTIANVLNRTVTISNFQAAVVAGRSSRCGYHGWHVLEPDAGTASGAAHSIVAGVQVTELLTEKQIAAACKLAGFRGGQLAQLSVHILDLGESYGREY